MKMGCITVVLFVAVIFVLVPISGHIYGETHSKVLAAGICAGIGACLIITPFIIRERRRSDWVSCLACRGSGRDSPTQFSGRCIVCRGRGRLSPEEFEIQFPLCPTCGGLGSDSNRNNRKCRSCRGRRRTGAY